VIVADCAARRLAAAAVKRRLAVAAEEGFRDENDPLAAALALQADDLPLEFAIRSLRPGWEFLFAPPAFEPEIEVAQNYSGHRAKRPSECGVLGADAPRFRRSNADDETNAHQQEQNDEIAREVHRLGALDGGLGK